MILRWAGPSSAKVINRLISHIFQRSSPKVGSLRMCIIKCCFSSKRLLNALEKIAFIHCIPDCNRQVANFHITCNNRSLHAFMLFSERHHDHIVFSVICHILVCKSVFKTGINYGYGLFLSYATFLHRQIVVESILLIPMGNCICNSQVTHESQNKNKQHEDAHKQLQS